MRTFIVSIPFLPDNVKVGWDGVVWLFRHRYVELSCLIALVLIGLVLWNNWDSIVRLLGKESQKKPQRRRRRP